MIKTNFVIKLLEKYNVKSPLTKESKQTIEEDIIRKYRYFITASFIADVVNPENSKENWKWVIMH